MTASEHADERTAGRDERSAVTNTPVQRLLRGVREHPEVPVWILLCGLSLVLLDQLHTPTTFWFDEWGFVFTRRGNDLDTFLQPHNGHLSIVPVAMFKLLFATVGLDHYRPYRIAGLTVHIATASLLFAYVRRRLDPVAGVSAGVMLLLLGSGWQNILWPFQIGFMGAFAFGILAWFLMDRRTARADVAAAVALALALGCSGGGIAVTAAAAVYLVVERAWRRLAIVVAPPAVLYGAWYLAYGESQGSNDDIGLMSRFVGNEASASFAALGGRGLAFGKVLLVMTALLAAGLLVRRRVRSATVVLPLAGALIYWALIAYSRAQYGEYAASRYVYAGALMLLVLIAELLAGIDRRVLAVAPLVAALSVWGNWASLGQGALLLREPTTISRAELRALEWSRDVLADQSYRPDEYRMPQVFAHMYFDAIDDLRSPAAGDGEVAVASAIARAEVDRVSLQAQGAALLPSSTLRDFPLSPIGTEVGERPIAPGTCFALTAIDDGVRLIQVRVPTGAQLVIESLEHPVDIRLVRYADAVPNVPTFTVASGASGSLRILPDGSPRQTWLVDVRSPGDLRMCDLAPL